jgi:hypothetical protein
VTFSFDEAIKRFAANPEMGSPITRLVFFKHLTTIEGMAGRRYGDIMRTFDRYHTDKALRTARSQSFEPTRGAEDQEIERRHRNMTMADYEADARHARRQYNRLQKVLSAFADPITGRNQVKSVLDDLCCSDIEPASQYRDNCAAVLRLVAKEFGLGERPTRRVS